MRPEQRLNLFPERGFGGAAFVKVTAAFFRRFSCRLVEQVDDLV
jgi:hypothetical protein